MIISAFDAEAGSVEPFEELIGSHGGLGGPQTDAFILYPAGWQLDADPPVGAPALYQQLRRWRAGLATESAG